MIIKPIARNTVGPGGLQAAAAVIAQTGHCWHKEGVTTTTRNCRVEDDDQDGGRPGHIVVCSGQD